VVWDAPQNLGLVDSYAPNDRLRRMRLFSLLNHSGPEDIVAGPNGQIYTATSDGNVIQLSLSSDDVKVFAHIDGRPLGLEFTAAGELIMANAYVGLQNVIQDGSVEMLDDKFKGENIQYADDVAVADDGIIYFSGASSKHGVKETGRSYES
jgi:sugar lactone lactonase YvrE